MSVESLWPLQITAFGIQDYLGRLSVNGNEHNLELKWETDLSLNHFKKDILFQPIYSVCQTEFGQSV